MAEAVDVREVAGLVEAVRQHLEIQAKVGAHIWMRRLDDRRLRRDQH